VDPDAGLILDGRPGQQEEVVARGHLPEMLGALAEDGAVHSRSEPLGRVRGL